MNPSRRPSAEREDYRRIRNFCFSLLEDRAFPLSVRILRVGKVLQSLEADPRSALSTEGLPVAGPKADLSLAWGILLRVSGKLLESSRTLSGIRTIPEGDGPTELFFGDHEASKRHFEEILPDWEILFEKMLVNNLFFRQFPFRPFAESLSDEFAALCGTYLFLRYMALVMMKGDRSRTDFVDLSAKSFRFIAHSRFEHNVILLLREEKAADFDSLSLLIGL